MLDVYVFIKKPVIQQNTNIQVIRSCIPCNWMNRVWFTQHWHNKCPTSVRHAITKSVTPLSHRWHFLTRITSAKQQSELDIPYKSKETTKYRQTRL